MSLITEEQVELQSIEWFKELGYHYKNGYEMNSLQANIALKLVKKKYLYSK